jgi:septum formation protein
MKLYLASSSEGRKKLLEEALIPFETISHSYDEIVEDENLFKNITKYTLFVASQKINHIVLPEIKKDNDLIAVLCADTMNQTEDGKIIGKATNLDEARLFMKRLSGTYSIVTTSYILNTYYSKNNHWFLSNSIKNTVSAKIYCVIDEDDIFMYLDTMKEKALSYSGGFSVLGLGAQFIKKIEGSSTTIVGLPMNEIRADLKKIGFF